MVALVSKKVWGVKDMVGATRFERATSSTPWKRATKLRHAPTRTILYLIGMPDAC